MSNTSGVYVCFVCYVNHMTEDFEEDRAKGTSLIKNTQGPIE